MVERQIQFENVCKQAIENGRDTENKLAQVLLWCSVMRGDPDLLLFALENGASVNIPLNPIILQVLNHYHYITECPDSFMDIF
jgi:hypothetical protein